MSHMRCRRVVLQDALRTKVLSWANWIMNIMAEERKIRDCEHADVACLCTVSYFAPFCHNTLRARARGQGAARA